MKSFLLLSLLLGELFLISTGQGVIFCVKPNSTDTCSPEDHCQQCQTLQYYCDNDNATNGINKQNNVTMIFMEGTHTLNASSYAIYVPTLSMKGKSKNNVSLIIDGLIDFKIDTLSMENITIISLNHYSNQEVNIDGESKLVLKDCTFQGQISITGFPKAVLKKCKFGRFYDTTFLQFFMTQEIILEECDIHGAGIDIHSSYGNVVIKGDSKFSACHINPAISIWDFTDQGNITLSGKVTFVNNIAGAMYLHFSTLTIASGANINFINNSVMGSGGAMYLYSSHFYVESDTNISFASNSAFDRGGAIFIEPGIVSSEVRERFFMIHDPFSTFTFGYPCFINSLGNEVNISFGRNIAGNGGDDIYGASLECCTYPDCSVTLKINRLSTPSISSVSSNPLRVCLCDNGVPQCNLTHMYQKVHPGESFTVSAVLVGWDYSNSVTTGVVYADILPTNNPVNPQLDSNSQNGHVISNSKQCTNLSFSLDFSTHIPQNTTMYVTAIQMNTQYVLEYTLQNCLYPNDCLHTAPVFFNLTLFPCLPGFTLIAERCTCYLKHVLFESCSIVNGIGYFSWNRTAWVSISDQEIQYNTHCPFDYCNITDRQIDLQNNSDTQCAFNRAGRLCGGCKKNYSLTIGSSHCIHCPNNKNLALLIFFAAAGFLMVFFISAFNLTVTQGMINGLIFYANIVWAYQGLLFPQQSKVNANVLNLIYFEKTFIAWLNLDFGIEACFFNGLNAFWKIWLQYVFPTYTAGLFFIGLRYSSKLSKLFGNRSVPTLATLLFLSYTKLLRTIITSLELARLTNYPNTSSVYVWSIDGTLDYGQFPHITLLIMAIACLLILWLPYTMLLFLMQWLRRIPNYRISKWITRYKPVIDAYFAPLKDKQHYWFGVLLLSRGILLIISSLTANINPAISLFLLHGVATLLLCYMNFKRVYKSKSVLILESAFLINLIILTAGAMYYNDKESSEKVVLIGLSIGIAFIKFCGIIIWSIVQLFPSCSHCQRQNNVPYENIDEDTQLFQGRETIQVSGQPRDPILEDSQLIPTY